MSTSTLDDVGPVVTTKRYHNNGRLIMLEVKCIKFSLDIQNSLGLLCANFTPFSQKLREWQHLSAYFLNTPRMFKLTGKKIVSIFSSKNLL